VTSNNLSIHTKSPCNLIKRNDYMLQSSDRRCHNASIDGRFILNGGCSRAWTEVDDVHTLLSMK